MKSAIGKPEILRRGSGRLGFTLVELLVVVTIIVVLLAMLAPAMDRAVYQAELAACGSKLKAIAGGMVEGAVERNRTYPQRTVANAPISVDGVYAPDERPVLRSYLNGGLNGLMNCPLSKAVDIEAPGEASTVTVSYALWFGWSTNPDERRLQKVGDRWTWDGRRFDTIAGDCEYFAFENNDIYGSHPDEDGPMTNIWVQSDAQAGSVWFKDGVWRGDIDVNHASEDGAVQRYDGVPAHDAAVVSDPTDERLADVPFRWNMGSAMSTDGWNRVPRGR